MAYANPGKLFHLSGEPGITVDSRLNAGQLTQVLIGSHLKINSVEIVLA